MLLFKIVWLTLCVIGSTSENCVKYQNVSNIVVVNKIGSPETALFTVYSWGEKTDEAMVMIHHPKWQKTEIDNFNLPTRRTESNPLKTERLAIPLMQIVDNNLQKCKKYENYIEIETLNRTTIHLFEKEWSEYRPNYKLILFEQPNIMKCRTVHNCQPLQNCTNEVTINNLTEKLQYAPDIFQQTLATNTIYLKWMEINQTVSIQLQINNLLLFCHDKMDILKIDNVQIRTDTLQKYRKGMYSFVEATEPHIYEFQPKFNLERNYYVHLLVALCTLCKVEIKLMHNISTVDETYLDGIDYKNQNNRRLNFQSIYLTTPKTCNDCFIKITTISNEIHPFWIITNELQIGRIINNVFVSSDSVSRDLITTSKTIQNSLTKRFINNYKTLLLCEIYDSKKSCMRPNKLEIFEITLYRDSPILIKWCENKSNLPYKYYIEVFDPRSFSNNFVLEKIKIVNYTAQFGLNCFIEPLLHLESKTIYGVQILSSISEGFLYFQTP